MEAQHTPGSYVLVNVHSQGYSVARVVEAVGKLDACRQHVEAWHQRRSSPAALVLRLPQGGRLSVRDSEDLLKATGSAALKGASPSEGDA